jgi:hypothetical protein
MEKNVAEAFAKSCGLNFGKSGDSHEVCSCTPPNSFSSSYKYPTMCVACSCHPSTQLNSYPQPSQNGDDETGSDSRNRVEEVEGLIVPSCLRCIDVRSLGWDALQCALVNHPGKAKFVWDAVHGMDESAVKCSGLHKTLSQDETSLPHPSSWQAAVSRLSILAGRIFPHIIQRFQQHKQVTTTRFLAILTSRMCAFFGTLNSCLVPRMCAFLGHSYPFWSTITSCRRLSESRF